MKTSSPWMLTVLTSLVLLSACESFPDDVEQFHSLVLRSYDRFDQSCESAEQISSNCQTVFSGLDASLDRAATSSVETRPTSRNELLSGLDGSLKSLQAALDQSANEILDHQVRALELALAQPEEYEAAQARVAAGERESRSEDPVDLAVWLLLQIDRDLDRANRYSSRMRDVPAELRIQADAITDLTRSLQAMYALDERARLLTEMPAGERADLKAERALALEEARAARARYSESNKITDAILYDKVRAPGIEKAR